jgi:hypothetical protein
MATKIDVHLLALPYDIRHVIYQELFQPYGRQIYIQATADSLISITPDQAIPTALLRTCRQLHLEATEYLYSHYLFNIIGKKEACLARYGSFLRTVKQHANDEVHVDAFSNGPHSATMCISIHAGRGKAGILTKRDRGVRMSIAEVQREVVSRTGMIGVTLLALRELYFRYGWLLYALTAIIALLISVRLAC